MIRLLLLLLTSPALGQTIVNSDAWISGSLGVGTSSPGARLEVDASSASTIVFQVSDITGYPIMSLDQAGRLGMGVAPTATLDINGAADNSTLGLQLRSGNLYPSASSTQLAFGVDGTVNLSHAIRTVHSTATANNSMDFLLWNAAQSTTSVGNLEVLSLVTISSSASSTEASFHIMPVGVSTVEVTVSNGATLGGGTVHRAAEITHSSRELKSDIAYLAVEDERRAYQEVAGLKHAAFRYKILKKGKLKREWWSKQSKRRGLIYEDSPDDIKGPGRSIILDERVNNAELAAKEMMRRLEMLESEANNLGKRP